MRPLVPAPAGPSDWQTRFFHSDYIGSIRTLTDDTGAVTDRYQYDAWGNLLGHVGSDPQPYAFAGEPYDANVGFQYHRARWMDPRVGRFVAMDPWQGSSFDPVSLHRYLYASGDPVLHTDPTGQFTLSESTVVSGIISVLSAGVMNAMLEAVFTGARGQEITAEDLRDAFLLGAITAPVGGLLARASAPLLRASLEPFLIAVGSMRRVTLVGTTSAWERFLVKFSRVFFNTNVKYPPVAGTPLGRALKWLMPGIEWQQHHIFIQQAWSRVGSQQQLYSNVLANEGLRRIGNGLWNLIPIPAGLNNWLGRSPIAAQMIATMYYVVVVFGPAQAVDGFTELEDDGE
jgi:RHS repeat-associated protein